MTAQFAAQAAVNANLTDTLAAVLGGLSALQAGFGSLAARMDAVEANMGLLDSLVVSPPMPPPSPSPPPPPPPSPGPQFTCTQSDSVCAALGSLYKSAGGSSWANQDGWSAAAAGTATSYCNFHGVQCSGGAVMWLCGRARGAGRERISHAAALLAALCTSTR